MKRIGWPGKGYKFSCHRCGFWFPSTEILKEWTGLYVCKKDYESRHPQTLIKVHGEKAFPEFVSKDGTDSFISICDAATSSGYADLGAADCMRADYGRASSALADYGDADVSLVGFEFTAPYQTLLDIYGNGH